jgi:hypothetical protein
MPAHTKLDERHHVDLPFMEQLDGSGWNMVGQTVDVLECAEKPHQNGKPGALS